MISLTLAAVLGQSQPGLVFSGKDGPGQGRHIVLLAGDEEYRSEEALPQLAQILSERHGFTCTVLFSMNEKGEVDPTAVKNQPGLEALKKADLVVMMLRFREWPDQDMKLFSDYWQAGKPIVAIRTSTHAFNFPAESTSPFRRFSWASRDWRGGFGKQVLGETWISHWGNHGTQATRGIPEPINAAHPLLLGVRDVFGPTDVYEAYPPEDAKILMRGEVVEGMKPTDPAASYTKKRVDGGSQDINSPRMPIVWLREVDGARIFTTTLGTSEELLNEGFRRLMVNSVYWGLKMESSISPTSNVDLVGSYKPSPFGFGTYRKGAKPTDFVSR